MIWLIRVLAVLLFIFFIVPAIYYAIDLDFPAMTGSLAGCAAVVWVWAYFEERKRNRGKPPRRRA